MFRLHSEDNDAIVAGEAARRVLSTILFRNPLRIMKSLQKCPLCLLSVQILPFAASSLHFCLFLALSGFHQRFVFLHTLERASQSICWLLALCVGVMASFAREIMVSRRGASAGVASRRIRGMVR